MRTLVTVTILLLSMQGYAAEAKSTELPGRLKFRDGPVCMCSTGLSEKDIRAVLEGRDGPASDVVNRLNEQTKTIRRGEKEEQ